MAQTSQVIIIGAGPIGLACGLACLKQGLTFVILEKGALVNSIYNYPANMRFFSTSEKLEIGGIPFISKEPKPNRDEALEYYRRTAELLKNDLHLFEKVERVAKDDDGFQVVTQKAQYHSAHVIVATGFYDLPKLLEVRGEDLPHVKHYFTQGHPYIFKKTIVVGASNSAVDAALEIHRKGGEVTMVVRGEQIGDRVKYWVRPDIINRISEGSIKAYFGSQITEIHNDRVDLTTPEGPVCLENDYVLALTGYQPNLSFLEALGVHLHSDTSRRPQYDPDTLESNVTGLYLAGVICGGLETHLWFIENSRVHADLIVADILRK
jgi:thioredoxin reductase (NADPH)